MSPSVGQVGAVAVHDHHAVLAIAGKPIVQELNKFAIAADLEIAMFSSAVRAHVHGTEAQAWNR